MDQKSHSEKEMYLKYSVSYLFFDATPFWNPPNSYFIFIFLFFYFYFFSIFFQFFFTQFEEDVGWGFEALRCDVTWIFKSICRDLQPMRWQAKPAEFRAAGEAVRIWSRQWLCRFLEDGGWGVFKLQGSFTTNLTKYSPPISFSRSTAWRHVMNGLVAWLNKCSMCLKERSL